MTRITGSLRITGGLTINLSNLNNFFTTQPSDWLGFETDSGANITSNTLTTGPSNNSFVFGDIATQTALIGMFGDPGVNSAHGGHFSVTWSAGSTLSSTDAFVVLYTGTDGPVPVGPGEYAVYVQLVDTSYNNIGAGTWNFPATFTLITQLF
jgi:hypothetical protein